MRQGGHRQGTHFPFHLSSTSPFFSENDVALDPPLDLSKEYEEIATTVLVVKLLFSSIFYESLWFVAIWRCVKIEYLAILLSVSPLTL